MKSPRKLPDNAKHLPHDIALCKTQGAREYHVLTQYAGLRVWNRDIRKWTNIGSGITICACGKILNPRETRVEIINADDFPPYRSICLSCLRATVGV